MEARSSFGVLIAIVITISACGQAGKQKPNEGGNNSPGLLPSPATGAALKDPLTDLPVTGSWRAMATAGAPVPCFFAGTQTFWTGSGLLVWGIGDGTTQVSLCKRQGRFYDTNKNTWTEIPAPPGNPLVINGVEIGNHLEFLLDGKFYLVRDDLSPERRSGQVYDFALGTWSEAPTWVVDLVYEKFTISNTGSGEFTTEGFVNVIPHGHELIVLRSDAIKIVNARTAEIRSMSNDGRMPYSSDENGTQKSRSYLTGDDYLVEFTNYWKRDDSGKLTYSQKIAARPLADETNAWKAVELPKALGGSEHCNQEGMGIGVSNAAIQMRMDSLTAPSVKNSDGTESGILCAIVFDPLNGTVSHQLSTIGKAYHHKPEGFDSIYYDPLKAVSIGTRAAIMLQRLGSVAGQTSGTLNGVEARLMIVEGEAGRFAVTPPMPGPQREAMHMVPTDKGVIIWGGDKRRGTDNNQTEYDFFSDGAILELGIDPGA